MFRISIHFLWIVLVAASTFAERPKVRQLSPDEKTAAVSWLKRAEAEAAKVTDVEARAELLNNLASIYGGLPDSKKTVALCKEARLRIGNRRDVPVAEKIVTPDSILVESAYALAMVGQEAEALKRIKGHDPFDQAMALAGVAEAQAFVGDWAKVEASVKRAEKFIGEELEQEDRDFVLPMLALAWVWTGDVQKADLQTGKIQAKNERIISTLDNAWLLLKSRRIDPAEARKRIRSVAIHFLLMDAENKGWCASTLGAIYAELGDVEGAKRTRTMTREPMHHSSIRLSEAEAMVRSGKVDGLAGVLKEAVAAVGRIDPDEDFPQDITFRGWAWYQVGYTHQFIGRAKDLESILKTIASPYDRGMLMGGAADAIVEMRRVPRMPLKQ